MLEPQLLQVPGPDGPIGPALQARLAKTCSGSTSHFRCLEAGPLSTVPGPGLAFRPREARELAGPGGAQDCPTQRSCPDTPPGRSPGGRFTEVEEVTSGFLQRYKTHNAVHVCGAGSSQAGGAGRPAPRSPGHTLARQGSRPGLSTHPAWGTQAPLPTSGPGGGWTTAFRTRGHPATPLLVSVLAATKGTRGG